MRKIESIINGYVVFKEEAEQEESAYRVDAYFEEFKTREEAEAFARARGPKSFLNEKEIRGLVGIGFRRAEIVYGREAAETFRETWGRGGFSLQICAEETPYASGALTIQDLRELSKAFFEPE